MRWTTHILTGKKKGNPKKNSRSHIEISENRNNVTKQSLQEKHNFQRSGLRKSISRFLFFNAVRKIISMYVRLYTLSELVSKDRSLGRRS